jgi:hypothetical protein
MKSDVKYFVKVAAIGFNVLVLFSVPLFWCRWLCEIVRLGIVANDGIGSQTGASNVVTIQPSGLVPDEYENASDVVKKSKIQAEVYLDNISYSLGIMDYIVEISSKIDNYSNDAGVWTGAYFDKTTGQIIYQYRFSEPTPFGRREEMRAMGITAKTTFYLYAGPEGIAETHDNKMGRFNSPITADIGNRIVTLYDTKFRRFFNIDISEKTVLKGPELPIDKQYNPVAIYPARREIKLISLNWWPPMIRDVQQTDTKEGESLSNKLTSRVQNYVNLSPYTTILDKSGRIDLLDKTTLKFVGTAGFLPNPPELYPIGKPPTTSDVLAYRMLPMVLSSDRQYRGLFVTTLNREGTSYVLTAFDPNGHVIASTMSQNSPKKAYLGLPWLPTLTIAKYLLENLHPPILALASFLTADSIGAGAGYRGIFLLPNSYVAMRARGSEVGFAERLSYAVFLFMSPGIILAFILAWRINKDALILGMSHNARTLWTLGVIAFGLAGYITYRLCRPGITLVTCANCGKPRRPDMEKCHRCNSGWDIPELVPPSWRVVG